MENIPFLNYQHMHTDCKSQVIDCPAIVLYAEEISGRYTSVCLKKKCKEDRKIVELYYNEKDIGQVHPFKLRHVFLCPLFQNHEEYFLCPKVDLYDRPNLSNIAYHKTHVSKSAEDEKLFMDMRSLEQNHVPCPDVFKLEENMCYWKSLPHTPYDVEIGGIVWHWVSPTQRSSFWPFLSDNTPQEVFQLPRVSSFYECLIDPVILPCDEFHKKCHIAFCYPKKSHKKEQVWVIKKPLKNFEHQNSQQVVALIEEECPFWVFRFLVPVESNAICAVRLMTEISGHKIRKGKEVFINEEAFEKRREFYSNRTKT